MEDNIFQENGAVGDFQFDARVTRVFDDMINRSVPCYDLVQSIMVTMAQHYYQMGTVVYDLGCSLAETSLRLASVLSADAQIIGIDKSPAMVEAARAEVAEQGYDKQITIKEGSIKDELPVASASVVIISLTLQFVRPLEREKIIKNACNALRPGGVLLVFEKTLLADPDLNRLFIDKYYAFKVGNGYSDEEVLRKRLALENVLIPFTIEENLRMIAGAGFGSAHSFFQWLNFSAFMGVKPA